MVIHWVIMRPPLRRALAILAVAAACSSSGGGGSGGGSGPLPNFHQTVFVRKIVDPKDLVDGPVGNARLGDWLLYNDRVRFVIADVGPSDGYDPNGGKLVAADLVRPAGTPGLSRFGEVFTSIGYRGSGADKIEIVTDGTDGDEAQLRVTGIDVELPMMGALFGPTEAPASLGAHILRDYVLKPGESVLHETLTVENDAASDLPTSQVLTGIAMNRGQHPWAPQIGFDFANGLPVTAPLYAAVGDNVSYAIFEPRDEPTIKVMFAKVVFLQSADLAVPAGQSRAFELDFAVGDGDAASLLAAKDALDGQLSTSVAVTGAVTDPAGAGVPGARVHAVAGDGTVASYARTHADGTYALAVVPGTYSLLATADARAPSAPTAVTVGDKAMTQALSLGPAGAAHLSATEGGKPVPAKFTLSLRHPGAALPDALGEPAPKTPRVYFAPTGSLDVALPPGTYDTYASRGLEYDLWRGSVDAGASGASASAVLHHVVDSTGQLSGDFHIHARFSADAEDLLSEKVAAFAAEGLELPVSTEHEYIGDFAPAVQALGLGAYMHSVVGTELTTFTTGHFNVFPLVALPAARNRGAFDWFNKAIPDVMQSVRAVTLADGTKPILQMNHPRSLAMAYLDAVDFDAQAFGPRKHPLDWFTDFDAMEVWNGGPLERAEGSSATVTVAHPTMLDWFSFLNHGVRITGTGNSDSHKASTVEVGFPRNLVSMPVDDPAQAKDADLVASLRGGRSVVDGGFLVGASVGGKGPGEVVVPGTDGVVHLGIRVQAPLWVGPVESVDVIANGVVVQLLTNGSDFSDAATAVERPVLAGTLDFKPAVDTWYVVRARGTTKLWPVVGNDNVGYGFTNPIYVDVNGDGFKAPQAP